MTARYHLGFAAAAGLALLCGCAMQGDPTSGTPANPTTMAASGSPYSLYTHCGIHEALVQGTYFVADEALDDGHGNPPEGWKNPYQPGAITVTGPKAIFRDDAGHTVTFHARPGATGFLNTCS